MHFRRCNTLSSIVKHILSVNEHFHPKPKIIKSLFGSINMFVGIKHKYSSPPITKNAFGRFLSKAKNFLRRT